MQIRHRALLPTMHDRDVNSGGISQSALRPDVRTRGISWHP
jgi:hypothetical protein